MGDNNTDDIYAIVEFLPSPTDGKKEVDIVPSSWLTQVDEESYSYYPDPDNYHKLDKYVQELRNAKNSWSKYPVQIISYADYSQAKRRLKRSFTTTNVKSTDESSRPIGKPLMMSQARVLNEMNDVLPMHDEGSSSGFIEKNKSKKKMNSKLMVKKNSTDTITMISEAREGIDLESLKEFISAKMREQTESVKRYLINEKKSLQYDMKKYVDEIKNTLIANKVATNPQQSASSAIETLNVELPIKNLGDFQKFDTDLTEKASKREALLTFFRIKIFGENTAKGCITKMASALITKNVEKNYSGTGKKIKGERKLNFSATETFKCMEDVVKEKLGDCEDCKHFAGKVGRWLSGQGDREQGRKQRSLSL
ncbi:Protein of unknown function [Cotesia congregata]|uniref:DUF4806 domain-containing protein n=1 Tax=Cotesia congregata TaxID=51543 RepID=A0A8J2MRV8_COTCN|nr:Protein of unknown function [Cotesia congregata]